MLVCIEDACGDTVISARGQARLRQQLNRKAAAHGNSLYHSPFLRRVMKLVEVYSSREVLELAMLTGIHKAAPWVGVQFGWLCMKEPLTFSDGDADVFGGCRNTRNGAQSIRNQLSANNPL